MRGRNVVGTAAMHMAQRITVGTVQRKAQNMRQRHRQAQWYKEEGHSKGTCGMYRMGKAMYNLNCLKVEGVVGQGMEVG